MRAKTKTRKEKVVVPEEIPWDEQIKKAQGMSVLDKGASLDEFRKARASYTKTVIGKKLTFCDRRILELENELGLMQLPIDVPKRTNGNGSGKRNAAVAIVNEQPGIKMSKLVNAFAEWQGEDHDDDAVRRRLAGALNSYADEGYIFRDKETDQFYPVNRHV